MENQEKQGSLVGSARATIQLERETQTSTVRLGLQTNTDNPFSAFAKRAKEKHQKMLEERGITEEQYQAELIADKERQEREEYNARLASRMKSVPAGLHHCTFESYKLAGRNKLVFEKASGFINGQRSLYIFGDVGCGKTHLLVASFIESIKRDVKNRFIRPSTKMLNVAKMLHIRRDDYQTREEAEVDFVEKLTRGSGEWNTNPPDFIYLDDMCAENITPRTVELLYLIFNDVIEIGHTRLFITGNKPIEYISKNISDRIASRIVGLCGKDNIIKVEGDDFRLK